MEKMKIQAHTVKQGAISNIMKDKRVTIIDCRGNEDEGYEYLVDFRHNQQPWRIWTSEDNIIL